MISTTMTMLLLLIASSSQAETVNLHQALGTLVNVESRRLSVVRLFRPATNTDAREIQRRLDSMNLPEKLSGKLIELLERQANLWQEADNDLAILFANAQDGELPRLTITKFIAERERAFEKGEEELLAALDELVTPQRSGILLEFMASAGSMEFVGSPVFNTILDVEESQVRRLSALRRTMSKASAEFAHALQSGRDPKVELPKFQETASAISVRMLAVLHDDQLDNFLLSQGLGDTDSYLRKMPNNLRNAFSKERRLTKSALQAGGK